MPPRLPQTAVRPLESWRLRSRKPYSSSCLICASTAPAGCGSARRRRTSWLFLMHTTIRKRSTHAVDTSINRESTIPNPIENSPTIKTALNQLQKHFRAYVNISRLQLALRALEQKPGEETIRIAILALPGQVQASIKARELVRLLLADPLKKEEEWERSLTADQGAGKPVLLRIEEAGNHPANLGINNRLIEEFSISSPTLNAHRLEILVMEADNLSNTLGSPGDITDAVLVPSVEIPVSSTGKYTPVTTPVHKAVLLGDGILGAASLIRLPLQTESEIIASAVDLPGLRQDVQDQLPFQVLDVSLAKSSLESFRENVGNAMNYEHKWFKSGAPELLQWIKAGTLDTPGLIKSPICALIVSVLADASWRIEQEETRRLSTLLSSKVSSPALVSLRDNLNLWAQHAHTELRDQLDIAFEGKRWNKLSWWKLFWRVDDVSMIASDILYQRFLMDAEKEIIYLAGKIDGAGVLNPILATQKSYLPYQPVAKEHAPRDLGSLPPNSTLQDSLERPQSDSALPVKQHPWPLQIPTVRLHLFKDTVPALQALGQRLVVQTLTTSSLASVIASLMYLSSFSIGIYEAGAVAALGIVWSMRVMQKKWETARKFWEGEVREEGRKAVRAIEGVVREELAGSGQSTIDGAEELRRAKQAVEVAKKALERASNPLNNQ